MISNPFLIFTWKMVKKGGEKVVGEENRKWKSQVKML